MNLFLSAIRLPNELERAKLFGDKTPLSVVIVPNAWDPYSEDRQKTELESTISDFKKLGFKTSTLDLITSSDKQKIESLSSNDFLWVMGGNTFYLNYYVQKTGFDQLIKNALSKGLVYGGTSAGAVITGPTLHGTENADDPKDAPQIIWDGLKLVDFGIVPHWGMEKYGEVLEKMKAEQQLHVTQVVTLTNKQALTVMDDNLEIS